ncbi:tRNA (5-methylaminomethyl-2-thiouridine)(34)-methyltransferase MnmD [Sphingobacterium oryzagri]|uniref:tRNA (5-methylaminomethyl-2-thiouridine)(34)-methyltransferase MnmD n=1 Tax=Sphingobacterium oryzagri TaxID=3025669 RepID=A0ABY7WQ92_9SPHI|nr:tRNA (5-methylaminomethyl-2-thiouridine)(34)-methyltransferase MnmD [Sphingobacterium sp. KACC 22765]WDF69509.1 tRNA (5-methylaminomethyl-2-thiouridine)(34)-methyltransferase MnmD [Sphingobacterium sp. KACC 22765]
MEFVTTGDGSATLYHPEVGEHYHSKHGALQESRHVFLHAGLQFFLEKSAKSEVSVLEVGFGTGLNFLLSADYALQQHIHLRYCGIEAFPLAEDLLFQTGYDRFVDPVIWQALEENYAAALQNEVQYSDGVRLAIAHQKVLSFASSEQFDVIYFDAFAAVHQPEMWTDETLAHVCQYLRPGGVFVTYAITGNLKRSMKALGFSIEKAPGAPGKREMLRAVKK